MKVALVVNDLHLSGGVGTIVRHGSLLRSRHGFDVDLVCLTGNEHPVWNYRHLRDLPVRTPDEAFSNWYDIAIATWWETTVPLFQIPASRYAYFVQSLEDRFYSPLDATKRFAASLTYELPLSFLTEARWIADTLRALRPDAECLYVRNGIDKESFRLTADLDVRLRRPLRVLVEGRLEVWFKGVSEALDATSRMDEDSHVTLVTTASDAATTADRVLGPLNERDLARVYGETDVVLKLSRVEGMYGPPLEGFHLGATCITTPVTGHDEYVVHGWNGLVVDWDDPVGTARALDLLARNRRLLHYLRLNALATARNWPSWHQSSDFMALALRRIAQRAVPRSDAAGRSLARVRLELEQRSAFAAPIEGNLRAAVLNRLWQKPLTARLLRVAYSPPFFRPLRWLAKRLLD